MFLRRLYFLKLVLYRPYIYIYVLIFDKFATLLLLVLTLILANQYLDQILVISNCFGLFKRLCLQIALAMMIYVV